MNYVYLVADYGAGDLAWAEVNQSLRRSLGEVAIQQVAVPAFDTYAAGFCVAQLALRAERGEIIYHNVAPRRESGTEPEALLATKTDKGAIVVGPGSGFSWSLIEGEVFELLPPANKSQFRSRDFFPEAIGEAVKNIYNKKPNPLGEPSNFSPPEIAPGLVLYTDGYGNIKTSWTESPLPANTESAIVVDGKEVPVVIAPEAFALEEGVLSLVPGSSGPDSRRHWELFLRGGSAARVLGSPPGGYALDLQK